MLDLFKKKQQKQNLKNNTSDKPKKSIDKKQLFSIITAVILALAHLAIIIALVLGFKFYGLYPEVFYSAIAIVICVLIIVDIIFFVGFNHKDLALKIITCVLAVFLLLGGTVGIYAIAKVNGMLSGVLGNGSSTQYETYSGVFVTYKDHYKGLSDLNDKKVGFLEESSDGLTYIAKGLLQENKVDYIDKSYSSNAELMQALIDGSVDAIAITSAYRDMYKNDENSDFKDYLEDFNDFYTFEKDLKITTNKSKKDLTKEPFNVLLIGYSRTDIGSSVGLADAIIVATINPQTYTVSMMSIARDSFVPIACYGGAYDKINSGRSTSRACFIETIEDFVGMDIDYYMEADYLAIVYMVNALGGVPIDNPVDFELDGYFVPAGQYIADGYQALEFCRERHHMPNGDFDRQKHQKEVIIAIAKKLIESGDASLGLTIMNGISEWFSTDFTFQELSTVFNLLLKTKNYTSLDTFDLVDFQTLRITGDGGLKYYSYSMHLPLWVYLIYKGSYDESMAHIQEVMGNYSSIDQENSFSFSARAPYVRPPFYSLSYANEFLFTPDPMPAYWANLKGMTLAEVYEWADANGVTVTVAENIMPGDERYDMESEGTVYSQSVAYGQLVSENPSGTIIMMGTGEIDEDKVVPNFVGRKYEDAEAWADKHGIELLINFNVGGDGEIGKVTKQSVAAYTDINECSVLVIDVKAGTYTIKFNINGHGSQTVEDIVVKTGDKAKYFVELSDIEKDTDGNKYTFLGWFTEATGGTQVDDSRDVSKDTTVYAHWEKVCIHEWSEWTTTKEATCTEKGIQTRKCSKCSKEEQQEIAMKEHTLVDDAAEVPATCTSTGLTAKKHCSVCGNTFGGEVIPMIPHSYSCTVVTPATCTEAGSEHCECSVCHDGYDNVIPADPSLCPIE